MGVGKELLLFFMVVMNFCWGNPKPVKRAELQKKMSHLRWFPLENLVKAEEDYVQLVFQADPPEEYYSQRMEPLDGITFPVGNSSEEIQDSVCSLVGYLEELLPAIINIITVSPLKEKLTRNTATFSRHFKRAANTFLSRTCDRNLTETDTYILKEDGLRILYFTRRWLTEFTDCDIITT